MKYILSVLFAFIFIGCLGGSKTPEPVSYPSWFLNPPQNNGSFLYGVGEGANVNEAKASALSSVSQSLSLSVSSQLKKSETSNRYNNTESTYSSVVSSLQTQTKEMEFSDYTIVKNAQLGPKIVLLVEVSRQKLFSDQLEKLNLFVQDIEAQNKSIAKQSLIEQALLYKKARSKAPKLKSLALLCHTIDSNFDTQPYLKKMNEIANTSDNALHKVDAVIKPSKEAQVFVNALKQGLNQEGLKVGTSHAKTQIFMQNVEQFDEIYGFKIAKCRVSFNVKEGKKTVATRTITLTGKSKYDYEKARINASNILSNMIKKEGVFSILGIQ